MNDLSCIYDALRYSDARLSVPRRWLVVESDGEIVVYREKRGGGQEVYRGEDMEAAVAVLLEDV